MFPWLWEMCDDDREDLSEIVHYPRRLKWTVAPGYDCLGGSDGKKGRWHHQLDDWGVYWNQPIGQLHDHTLRYPVLTVPMLLRTVC